MFNIPIKTNQNRSFVVILKLVHSPRMKAVALSSVQSQQTKSDKLAVQFQTHLSVRRKTLIVPPNAVCFVAVACVVPRIHFAFPTT